jgi:hypothetical protein
MRELILAVMLALASGAVVIGSAMVSGAAGWIVFGLLLAVWAWLVLGEVGG